jgi:hypothetical protein
VTFKYPQDPSGKLLMTGLVRHCVLHPEPRPSAGFWLSIYSSNEEGTIGYKFSIAGKPSQPIFMGFFELTDPEWKPNSDHAVVDLICFLCDEDCEGEERPSKDQKWFWEKHAEAVFEEVYNNYPVDLDD